MNDRASNPKQDFNLLYSDVASSLATATAEINKLEVDHKNGKQELGNILGRLRDMQNRFADELGMLEEHAEWEKFTIAFFGETNAGKSTIIESLRILFKEESRQQLLEQNAADLSRYQEQLSRHIDTVRQALVKAHAAYAAELTAVRLDVETRTSTLLRESDARSASIRHEVDSLERALQQEASLREHLNAALEKARRKVWLALAGGCALGSAAMGMIALALK